MMSRLSRKRARAVTGLIVPSFAQYSMPVPSGNANSMRPPVITSSIAYSSATRFGYSRLIGVPATVIFRDVDVVMVVEGVQLDVFEGAQPRHTSSFRDGRRAASRSGVRLRTRV